MTRSLVVLGVYASISIVGLVGCVGGPSDTGTVPASGTETGSSQGSSDSNTDRTDVSSADAGSSSKGGSSSVGPECTKYLACCAEVAQSQPALAGSCDSTQSAIEDAAKKGVSTSSYENGCKQALSSMTSAGYCN